MIEVNAIIELNLISISSGKGCGKTKLGVIAFLDDDHVLVGLSG